METSTTSTLKIFAGKNVQVNKKPGRKKTFGIID